MGQFRRKLLSVYARLFRALTKPWRILYVRTVAYRVDFFQDGIVPLVDILLCYKVCLWRLPSGKRYNARQSVLATHSGTLSTMLPLSSMLS